MPSLRKLAILAFFGSLFTYGVGVFVYITCGLLSFAAGLLFFLPEVHWVPLKRKIPISHGLVGILDYIINDYIRCWYTSLTNETEFPQQLHAAMAQLMAEVSKRAQRIDWIPFMIEGLPNIVIDHLRIHRRSLERYARSSDSAVPTKFFFDEEMETEVQFCREEVCTSREKELDHFRRITDVFLFAIMPEEDYRLLTVRYLLKCNESAFTSPYFIQSLRMSTREDELQVVKERIEIFAVKLRGRDSGGDDVNDLQFSACANRKAEQANTPATPLGQEKRSDEGLTPYYSPYGLDLTNQCGPLFSSLDLCRWSQTCQTYTLTTTPQLKVHYRWIITLSKLCEIIDKFECLRKSSAIIAFHFNVPKAQLQVIDYRFSIAMQCGPLLLEDTMVKAQINSLNFLENVCNSQIAEIKRGIPRKFDQRMNSTGPDSDGLGRTSIDLTFADIMSNDVAVSNFLEFLTSINEQSLLSLYLNCMAYRVNSEELMSSITSIPSTNESEDIFDPNSGWDEMKTTELESTLQQGGEIQEQPEISEEDQEAMGRIREFGVSMCNLVMRILPQIPEETVKRCLKALSTPLDTIDPNVFIDIEEELIRLLSSEQCFGAFKRSPYYARAVEVFKSSPHDVFLESSRRSGANGGEDVQETPSYSSKSASSSPVSSRPESAVSNHPYYDICPPSSTSYFPDSYTVNVLSGNPINDSRKMAREGYVVYTLEVTCLSTITGRRSTWRTYRRYSQFDDLHSLIVEQCGRIQNLKLPAKKSFTSVSAEFIEKRRSELDDYLQILCGIDTTGRYPRLHPILSNFLQSEKWERKKGGSSLMNPFKAVGSAIISVPDTLFDGFSKMINRRQPIDRSDVNSNVHASVSSNSMVSRPSLLGDTSNFTILDQNDSDNIPFRILFMLVDEVFNLQRKTQLFRRGTLAILRNIVQTFFGDIMNRRIVEKAKNLIGAKQMATYAGILRDVLWPNGSQVQTNGGISKSATPENSSVRDEAMKLRTRVLCRAVMFGSVAEELASYLGQETTREGVQRVFDLLQQPCLNRRLVHCLLEAITRLLLADQTAQLNEIYAQDYRIQVVLMLLMSGDQNTSPNDCQAVKSDIHSHINKGDGRLRANLRELIIPRQNTNTPAVSFVL
ncbi:hypothetical protein ACTXT7_006824 [Hymenolepis weldensis]